MKRLLVVLFLTALVTGFCVALSAQAIDKVAADDPTPTPTPTQVPHTLRYALLNYGSDYNTDINATTVFASAFEARTPHTADYLGCITVDNLNSSVDVLWMTGHNAFSFPAYQRILLRTYLEDGGVIWGDSCDPGLSGPWAQSFSNEMNIITGSTYTQIPNDHALYRSFYELDGAPPTALGNYSNFGWEDGGDTRVIISPNDYMCGLEDGEGWSLENSLQMSINLNIYAMYIDPHEVWVDDDYVNGSCGGHTWGYDAFAVLQHGIDNVSTLGTVHVAAGTYYENIVLKNGVELLGAGNAITIIDGNQSGPVITANNVGNTTKVDGFTITNGHAGSGGGMYSYFSSPNITNCIFHNNSATEEGGGMYNYQYSPTITNCIFNNNSAALRGGGMYNEGSSPVVSNCSFESNIAPYGAGICNHVSSPVISNCAFNNNSATSGGGMYNRNSASPAINSCTFYNNSASQRGGAIENYDTDCSPAITNCTFQSNHAVTDGGGIHNGQNSAPTINACIFQSNTANYGGGIYSYISYAAMVNCIFNNNSAVNGGGMYNSGSLPSPSIINCDFWNNSASNGGGMYNYVSTPAIYNCIVWNNSPEGIYNEACAPCAYNCDLQDEPYCGDYNIHVDPSFVDAAGGDFHLSAGSPCINTGDNLAPFLPSIDYEGDARTINGTVDMGADEYVPPIVTFPDPGLDAAVRAAINKSSGDIYQSDLDGLTSLNAVSMNISDLNGLEYCTSLGSLDLGYNQISNISQLSGLTGLYYLDLMCNQLSDISALSNLTSLQTLRLYINQISDISLLSAFTALHKLGLGGNQISNISALSGLTALYELDLGGNQVSNISALSGLINLQSLGLSSDQISDISALSGLNNLTALFLGYNQISNLSALSGLTNLSLLHLENNHISNISALIGFINLQWLDLGSNQINNISALSELIGLEILDFGWNNISNIGAISGLTNIRTLHLENNRISNLSPLSGLTSLMEVYSDSNQITDILPLVNNSGLATGDIVTLRTNPLSSSSINTHIPALQARGVNVYYTTPSGTSGDSTGDGELSIADYSSLKLMLLGKKAFVPGGDANGDGELSIMDYSALKLMLLGKVSSEAQYESSYDFSSGAGSDRWARSNSMSSIPPALSDNFGTDPDGWVNASTADYANISSTDANVWMITGSPGNYSALQCKFTLGVNPEVITSIGVTLNGSAETNGDVLRLWGWNFDAGAWTQIGGNLSMTTDIASYTAWTAWGQVYADYIDGDGYMYILANLNNADRDLNVDYFELDVVW